MLAAVLPEERDQLANLERQANLASREYQEPPESLVGLHLLASNLASPPANLAHLGHLDLPDITAFQVTRAHSDLPVLPAKMVKMANLALQDHPDLQERLDPMDPLVIKAKMDLKSQSFPEIPVRLVITAPLAKKAQLDLQDLTARQVSLVRKDPVAHLDRLERTANLVKRDPLELTVLQERRAFAPSIAHWMVEFSSKMEPRDNLFDYNYYSYDPDRDKRQSQNSPVGFQPLQKEISTVYSFCDADLLQSLLYCSAAVIFVVFFNSPNDRWHYKKFSSASNHCPLCTLALAKLIE